MSAIAETPTSENFDDSTDVVQVLFALHPSFGAQELCGPLEVLSNARHKFNDPSKPSLSFSLQLFSPPCPLPPLSRMVHQEKNTVTKLIMAQ